MALLAFEVADGRRIPILALLTTCAVWLSFETFGAATGHVAWLLYLAWTLPLAAHLALRLYRPSLPSLRAPVPAPA